MAFQLNVNLSEEDLMARLQAYQTEEKVYIVQDRVNSAPSLVDHDHLMIFFSSLHMLPRLRIVHVDFSQSPRIVPALALTSLLTQVLQLEKLLLEQVHFSGRAEDIQELAQALRIHPSLSELYVQSCRPASRDVTLEPILEALGETPCLEAVLLMESEIVGNQEWEWDGNCLLSLCSSQTIQILTFRDMPEILDRHVELMLEPLCNNYSLREFTLCSDNLGEAAATSVGSLLHPENTTSMTKLELQLQTGEQAGPLMEALKNNRSLTRLDLYFGGPITDSIRATFVDMLRHNCCLLDLNGSVWRGQSSGELDFLLRLNRAGRKDLLSYTATREQWLDILLDYHHDVSIIFGLLVMNPPLWMSGVASIKSSSPM